MSVPASRPARRLKAENRREQIMQIALTLFTERGFEGVGMADIAGALKTSRPTIYTYFPSTESILDALLAERLEHLPERLAPHLMPPDSNQIVSFDALFRTILEERELLLLLNSGGGPYFRSRRRAFLAAIEKRLNLRVLGKQKRALLGGEGEPLLLPTVLNLLTGMAYQQLTEQELSAEQLTAVLDKFILGGIERVLGSEP